MKYCYALRQANVYGSSIGSMLAFECLTAGSTLAETTRYRKCKCLFRRMRNQDVAQCGAYDVECTSTSPFLHAKLCRWS